jgi:hypothetical protein
VTGEGAYDYSPRLSAMMWWTVYGVTREECITPNAPWSNMMEHFHKSYVAGAGADTHQMAWCCIQELLRIHTLRL